MSSTASAVQERLLSEYAHLRQGSGGVLFDVSDRSLLELTGRDRASFLHNFCTNDIKKLRAGEGCEAFLTNIKGRILEHLFVFADPDSLWIDGTPGYEEAVSGHLDRYLITEDVQIHRRSAERGMIWVIGAGAEEPLRTISRSEPLPGERLRHHWISVANGERLHCRRFDLGGFPGWQLSGPRSAIEEVVKRLEGAGIARMSGELFEALRIESGLPRYGVDITDDHLAQESRRTAAAISFTKGCYLGQEPIARIDALGHVNRELSVLEGTAPSTEEISAGMEVKDAGGASVGSLTSAAWHPRTKSPWGLAVLKRSASTEGTRLTGAGGNTPFIVHIPLATTGR